MRGPLRRRFCSAAYQVFLKADAVAFVEPPDRGAAALDPRIRHGRDDFIQCHVRLLDRRIRGDDRVRSLSPEISRCRQKRGRSLWPRETFSRRNFLLQPETRSNGDRGEIDTQLGA